MAINNEQLALLRELRNLQHPAITEEEAGTA
jgi:hypothetical protein